MVTWKFENIDSIGTLSVRNIFVVESIDLIWYQKMLVEIAICSLAVVWQINLLFLRQLVQAILLVSYQLFNFKQYEKDNE